jgi:hypothetical protein
MLSLNEVSRRKSNSRFDGRDSSAAASEWQGIVSGGVKCIRHAEPERNISSFTQHLSFLDQILRVRLQDGEVLIRPKLIADG